MGIPDGPDYNAGFQIRRGYDPSPPEAAITPAERSSEPPSDPPGVPPPDPGDDPTAAVAPHAVPLRPPRIEGYRIVGLIGQGGMGVVFEAEQLSPRRRVALKVIRGAALVDEAQLRLFEREIQTLARLKHPGIATIHASGRTEDGQPYFTMELVVGETLAGYLARGRPAEAGSDGQRERLRLARDLCEVVHYAHQRGVIHRDLKPANILLVGEGDPSVSGSLSARHHPRLKVLDFGLARLTDGDQPAATATLVGEVRGTLGYMSPEQVTGESALVDVRSDVYSLGVILYELVTGARPYEVDRNNLLEAFRVICETPPRPPREAWRGARPLDRDLETIVLKALAKEPAARYQGAAALGEDIERHLTGQPILAHPPSAAYQLKKLMARHRLAFSAAAAFVVLLTAFAITMAVQAQRIARERDRAELEAARTTAVNGFMKEMLSAANPWMEGKRDATVLEALDTATGKIDASFRNQPRLRAEAIEAIASTYTDLSRTAPAESLYGVALAIRRDTLRESGAPLAALTGQLSDLRVQAGDLPGAERLAREALALNRRAGTPDDSLLARDLVRLAGVLEHAGRYAEADSLARASLELNVRVFGPASLPAAESLNLLARVAVNTGEITRADSLVTRVFEIRADRLGSRHPSVIASLADRGTEKVLLGRYPAAESLLTRAAELYTEVVGRDHPETASTLENLAQVYFREGRKEEALKLLAEVMEIRRRGLGDDHPAVARTLTNLATLCAASDRLDEAVTHYEVAAERFRRALGPRSVELATALSGEARVMARLTRPAEAEALMREVLEIRRAILPARAPAIRTALIDLGTFLATRRRAAEAELLLLDALEEQPGETPLGTPYRMKGAQALVDIYTAEGRAADAAAWRDRLSPPPG